MSLRKTENQVKDLLTETIVALCRNTLNRYGEVCVEGLLGVTLDKQEIFLVSINQQIENRKLGEQGIVHSSETSGDLSRKRANESDDDGTSDSYSEVSESDGSRVKRKRRRKRKHSRNSQGNSSGEESCQSGDDRETFPTFDLSELKKTGFLSQDSQFSVHSDGLNDFNDGVLSLENNQSHDLDAHQRLDTPIKSEVEDIDHQTSVIKEEREDEECWPSGDNLNEHSTTSGFQTQDKSLSNSHGANPGLGSDESEDADHSVSEQGGPGPSTLNSGGVRRTRNSRNGLGQVRSARLDLLCGSESGKIPGTTGKTSGWLENFTLPYGNPGALLLAPGLRNIPCADLTSKHSPTKIGLDTHQNSAETPVIAQVLNAGSNLFPPGLNLQNTVRALFGDEKLNQTPTTERSRETSTFPCELCGKLFQSTSHVRRHMLVHTGDKPFSCVICGMRFGQKATLKKHLKNIHDMTDEGLRAAL